LHRSRVAGSGFAERHGLWARCAYELVVFGVKQAWACLFGALMLGLLLVTHFVYPADAWLARYDFLVIAAVLIQALLLITKMETLEEAKVILLYHLVGTIMELFKTSVGSWQYPEESLLRIGGVPLFSGFMYASVGSFIARVWRLFDFRFTHYPRPGWTLLLALAIYINFFSHHVVHDMRLLLFGAIALLYSHTWVHFRIDREVRSMPLLLGFLLVSLYIWFAENLATYANAWTYPNQVEGWQMVGIGKLGSWFLLMIVSFVLVSLVNKPLGRDATDC
jgi:uncharacterized membrane protein YoaT (DUF817 family)